MFYLKAERRYAITLPGRLRTCDGPSKAACNSLKSAADLQSLEAVQITRLIFHYSTAVRKDVDDDIIWVRIVFINSNQGVTSSRLSRKKEVISFETGAEQSAPLVAEAGFTDHQFGLIGLS